LFDIILINKLQVMIMAWYYYHVVLALCKEFWCVLHKQCIVCLEDGPCRFS
jgi:hypothetical protein